MDSALTTVGLPIALGIIMFGLGLSLRPADFGRIRRAPVVVVVALVCQLLLLPGICFGLVVVLDLSPLLGIGMMLLAASPGGTTANLFSHLFRGDVALNVTLTAVNSIIAIITLPVITGLTIWYFGRQETVELPLIEVVKVFALVLVPVLLGMLVRSRRTAFADRMDRPVRAGSAIILAVLVAAIVLDQRESLGDYLARIGFATALFCALSLTIGYYVPRWFGVSERQSIASSMEIGVHNATLAIYVAVEILDDTEISIPAAVYSLFMFAFAALWGRYISRSVGPDGS